MPLVIVCYILANVSYFLVLPLATINSSNTVAVKFGSKVFGPAGALVFALIVSASCFGSLNSSTFTSSRLVYAAAKEGYVPAFIGRIGVPGSSSSGGVMSSAAATTTTRPRGCFARRLRGVFADEDTGLFFTPVSALVFNGLLTAGYVAVGEFGSLLTFYGVAGYSFYFLTVLGLIILRVREPRLERPYRTWVTTPIIFCCVSLFLLSRAVFAQPLQTLVVIAFVLTGIPVFFWRIQGRDQVSRRRKREAGADDGSGSRWKFWKWGSASRST